MFTSNFKSAYTLRFGDEFNQNTQLYEDKANLYKKLIVMYIITHF